MVAIPPAHPPTTANHTSTAGPATHPQQAQPRPQHSRQPTPTGGFTTIDAPPRRVAGVSHPYGRNSPHAPTHNRQPRTHPQPPATHPPTTANHATYSRPSHDQTQPPTHTNRGFYYHRHPTTACRRRVAALWSQFPPRPHPQPPTTPPTAGPATTKHNRQPRPRPCRFRATNLRLPLRTPRGGLPCAAWVPGRPGDIGSLSGTRRLGAPLHWCHA